MSKVIIKRGWVAMNEGEFDIENMSFFRSKKRAVQWWGTSQAIVKVKIEFIIK